MKVAGTFFSGTYCVEAIVHRQLVQALAPWRGTSTTIVRTVLDVRPGVLVLQHGLLPPTVRLVNGIYAILAEQSPKWLCHIRPKSSRAWRAGASGYAGR